MLPVVPVVPIVPVMAVSPTTLVTFHARAQIRLARIL